MSEPLFDAGAYDPVAAALAKSQSMEQVNRNADDAWKADAKGTVRFLAQTRETFTTDDVWFLLDKFPSGTHERRAMGPIMRWAATAGLVRATEVGSRRLSPASYRCLAEPDLQRAAGFLNLVT